MPAATTSSAPTQTPASAPVPIATRLPASPAPTAIPIPPVTPPPEAATPIAIPTRAPSLAKIETAGGVTTGILIHGGYVIAHAQSVWPFDRVILGLRGQDRLEAPVAAWDLLSGIVVIGPVDADVTPVSVAAESAVVDPENVYALGFRTPGQTAPSISTALVSGRYSWTASGGTYVSSDSGPGTVLVSRAGDAVAISLGNGYAADLSHFQDLAESLIAGTSAQDAMGLPLGDLGLRHSFDLSGTAGSPTFVIVEPSSPIDIRVDSEGDVAVDVLDFEGRLLLSIDGVFTGTESAILDATEVPPYYIVPVVLDGWSGQASLTASAPSAPIEDGDGAVLARRVSAVGAIQHPFDTDTFLIELVEGEAIELSAESITIDPVVRVDSPGVAAVHAAPPDASDGLVRRSELVYRATASGTYTIGVSSTNGSAVGGYVLTVSPASSGASAVVPEVLPTREVFPSPFGPMAGHRVAGLFEVLYPASWTGRPSASGSATMYRGPRGDSLTVLSAQAAGLDEYADRVLSRLESEHDGVRVLARHRTTTGQGEPAEEVVAVWGEPEVTGEVFVYARSGHGFAAVYSTSSERYKKLEPMIDYSFATFTDRQLARERLLDTVRPDRHSHTATLLEDGRLLIVGGIVEDLTVLESSALFDPVAGSWEEGRRLAEERRNHTATLLRDGTVLVLGGHGQGPEIHALAERYDPASGVWSDAGEMALERLRHVATLLENGTVLVTGGGSEISELYDPQTGLWSRTGSMGRPRDFHAAVMLKDGRVLVMGGVDDTTVLDSAEVYDHTTGVWLPTGSLLSPRRGHTASLLPDGRVLMAGGTDETEVLTTAEVFDPATGNWSPAGTLAEGRIWHTATLLDDGRVLVAGGEGSSGGLASVEVFDPSDRTWTPARSMSRVRVKHTANLLADGSVVVIGGGPRPGGVDIYDPATGEWSTR